MVISYAIDCALIDTHESACGFEVRTDGLETEHAMIVLALRPASMVIGPAMTATKCYGQK